MVEEKKENKMRKIDVEKLVVNISVGKAGDPLTRACKVLSDLADGRKPVTTAARITIKSFDIRRGDHIATHITLRGQKARDVLEKALKVKEYELIEKNFSTSGNFGFGLKEHIDLGIKYDPSIGIFGMNIYVVLGRKGFRVCRKKHKKSRVGKGHRVTREEARAWVKQEYGCSIRDKAIEEY